MEQNIPKETTTNFTKLGAKQIIEHEHASIDKVKNNDKLHTSTNFEIKFNEYEEKTISKITKNATYTERIKRRRNGNRLAAQRFRKKKQEERLNEILVINELENKKDELLKVIERIENEKMVYREYLLEEVISKSVIK